MKKYFNLLGLALLAGVMFVSACDDDTVDPGDSPSDYKYYIIADIGTTPYRYESNTPVDCYSFENLICFPLYAGFDNIGTMDFYDQSVDSTRADYIRQMKGKTYQNTSETKGFGFGLIYELDYYSMGNVDNADDPGSFTVTDVVEDGVAADTDPFGNPYKAFRVTGTFSCKLANSDGAVKQVSNGKFAIRFIESER